MDLTTLIGRAQRQDLDAFAEITRRFQHMAFGYAVSILRDLVTAEDVVQESFVAAWFGLASFFDHEPAVRLLLSRGARVGEASANSMRVMPLHSAAAARSVPIARLLLERGAPVNARQGEGGGFTPLMEAALNGQMDLIELLLAFGADRTLRDGEGRSAADHARSRGHEDAARYLGPG